MQNEEHDNTEKEFIFGPLRWCLLRMVERAAGGSSAGEKEYADAGIVDDVCCVKRNSKGLSKAPDAEIIRSGEIVSDSEIGESKRILKAR